MFHCFVKIWLNMLFLADERNNLTLEHDNILSCLGETYCNILSIQMDNWEVDYERHLKFLKGYLICLPCSPIKCHFGHCNYFIWLLVMHVTVFWSVAMETERRMTCKRSSWAVMITCLPQPRCHSYIPVLSLFNMSGTVKSKC